MHRSDHAPQHLLNSNAGQSPKSHARISLMAQARVSLASAIFACGMLANTKTADAVPAFARQTGYYCSTCHTAQPELTPFGRQFKLNGYTSGGSRCGDIRRIFGNWDLNSQEWTGANLAAWVMPAFQHTGKALPPDATPPGYPSNDIVDPFADGSVFFAGQIYCNLGIFSQYSYNRAPNVIFLDNTELRYTGNARVAGNDVVWGVLGNNNPTMQDVWNTAPAWLYPWVPQDIAPAPANGTLVEGMFGQRAGGAGAYLWVNNMFYAELSAYRSFNTQFLKATGSDPKDGTPRADGLMPYWRVAVEKTWNQNSVMVGTFGMAGNLQLVNGSPGGAGTDEQLYPGRTDKYTDVGIDAQYQYIGPLHAFTARAYYIWENRKLDASFFGSGGTAASRSSAELQSWNVSASYIYDRHISLTGAYFGIEGSADANNYWGTGNLKPNSEGLSFDLAYIPFPYGGPDLWPWLNARVGVLYTHYNKFDGTKVNASDNDTTFLYAWIDF
jgi:hypothetical protein